MKHFSFHVLSIVLFAHSLSFGAVRELGSQNGITHFQEEVAVPTDTLKALEEPFELAYDPDAFSRDPFSEIDLNAITNLGQKIWKVIEANRPVVNVKYHYANALPKGVPSSEDLDGFSDLQMRSFRNYAKNLYGITVYDVTYTAVHRFGGSYNGQGRFLENVTILPHHVDVLWGYTLNMGVSRISTVNVGTKDSPIGSIVMELEMRVSTVMKESQTRELIQFRGDSAKIITTHLR